MLIGTSIVDLISEINLFMDFGVIIPTVSGMLIISAPVFSAALHTCLRKGIFDRVASIGENSHFSPCFLMYSIISAVADIT